MVELAPIPNCPGYFITRSGRVWSEKSRKWLKPFSVRGYWHVRFRVRPRETKYYKVSRLLLETFVGPCLPGMECRHLDGNRQNDNLTNLTWGTRFENVQDRTDHGTTARGEKQGASRLTNKQAVEIRKLLAAGASGSELAKRYRVSDPVISNIKRQRTYLEVQQ